MSSGGNIIRYLKHCYEADNRESSIFNIFGDSVQYLYFPFKGGDFLSGTIDLVPVDRDIAMEAQKTAQLHRTEKKLLFGACMVVGKGSGDAFSTKELCAPLVFCAASIVDKNPWAFMSVDLQQQRVNTRLLAALLGESKADYLDILISEVPQVPFTRESIEKFSLTLEELVPNLDASHLLQFPAVLTEEEVRSEMEQTKKKGALKCLMTSAMMLVPNSVDTRGVLSELTQMADAKQWSAPVRMLCGEFHISNPFIRKKRIRVPASLNHSQLRAIESVSVNPLTLVIGPPGTGKSYTLAALIVDAVIQGKSVLVASKMNQALDVIARKIKDLVGDDSFVIRGGREGRFSELKAALEKLLSGDPPLRGEQDYEDSDIFKLEWSLGSQEREIARLERVLKRIWDREQLWGELHSPQTGASWIGGFLKKSRLHWLDLRIGRVSSHWEVMTCYQNALKKYHDDVAVFLRRSIRNRIEKSLRNHRGDLRTFSKSIRARTVQKQEEHFDALNRDVLLHAFPVWLTTLADVGKLAPLEAEMFDLAVIDEATQCDMSSCFPVFQRAKKAVITGDHAQLRHVSFLSRDRQKTIAEQHGLSDEEQETYDYRKKSMLDLMTESLGNQEQVVRLEEHYRSRPKIIQFSNREFYSNSLRIMSERPGTQLSSLVLRYAGAKRDAKGYNPLEANQVVGETLRWIKEEKSLSPGVCHSLGILSPFRDQVDYLTSLLSKSVDLASLRKHDVLIGTAHSFQGEERDVMMLSLVVDPESHSASLRFLSQPNLFNVTVTRARQMQIVFTSIRPRQMTSDSLVRRYLEYVESNEPEQSSNGLMSDPFMIDVVDQLQKRGFRLWPQYQIAGSRIDLVVEKKGDAFGVDLVGHPGPCVAAFDLERYRMFERAGLKLFPLTYSNWVNDRVACLDALESWCRILKGP